MADCVNNNYSESYKSLVNNSKLLVVGAGGIGCELLKNLVLTGFQDIHIIDLDTIDVSNLNRQFLFQKQHIGKSKAAVARESALKLRPNANITAYHDSVTNLRFGVDFFQQFSAVTNALDNRAARSHVNRMCLAADVPLVESGSAGYLGQVTVHKKGVTECYECQPKPPQKTFPGCTIRNTPSEPIHCIVWAKHLFNQLFGEEDADQDVSPDVADTELGDGAQYKTNETGNIERISTREWAKASNFEHLKLFNKLFQNDVRYLLSMEKLWRRRRAPIPLDWENLPDAVAGSSQQTKPSIKDQEIWSIKECASVFQESLDVLRKRAEGLNENDVLIWDKDDKHCMDFVTACSNLRAHCFGIPTKSPFDVKSLAGNIIPAIATTNAVIAGVIVLQLLKVLKGQVDGAKTVILNKHAAVRKTLLTPVRLEKPNPKCYACSVSAVVPVRMNVNTLTVKTLEEKILKDHLHMIAPDVEIDDGKGTILISSDPEEMGDIDDKPLKEFAISLGTRLNCDDFFQQFKFVLNVIPDDDMPDDREFDIIGDISALQPQEMAESMDISEEVDKDSDVTIVDELEDVEEVNEEIIGISASKRKLTEDGNGELPTKKKPRTFSTTTEAHDIDIL